MTTRVTRPARFNPTAPKSGSGSDDALYRMSNALIRGQAPLTYAGCYSGSLDLSETIATSDCAGTVSLTSGSSLVTGSGTTFIADLHLGQFTYVVDAINNRGFLLVVEQILSDLEFTCSRAPEFTGAVTGRTLVRLPVLFAVDKDRGTLIRGVVVRTDKGTLLIVGDGIFRLNGDAPTATITAARRPSIGLYDQTAGTYTQFPLGMDTSAPPTLAAVAGGVKGMQAGSYSLVITPARKETDGYNNPSNRADVTIATDDKIEITFPAMDTANGQNAWGVWVTTYADSLGADLNYLQGPWHFYIQVTDDDVSPAGGAFEIEYLDAEVETNEIVSFNNDAPGDAEYFAVLNNVPVLVSSQGRGSATTTSPGPLICPAKPDNIEAFPLELAFTSSPPEDILGVFTSGGRLYLLTANHLQVAQGTPSDLVPIIIQPYWATGFVNPYQAIAVKKRLYGFPVAGPTRSEEEGALGSEEDISAGVESIVSAWIRGHVLVAHDPVNNAVCFFHSANNLNADGFWTTRILVYGIRQGDWIGEVLLTSDTQDMIVTGVATVSGYLEFLAGGRANGRLSSNVVSIGTYRFDQAAGDEVPWYVAAQYSDNGDELRSHDVSAVRVTAQVTEGSAGVFGTQPTQVVDTVALEAGNSSSLTGAITLPTTVGVAVSREFPVRVSNLSVSTVRVEGVYAGSGDRDQVDEIALETWSSGVRR